MKYNIIGKIEKRSKKIKSYLLERIVSLLVRVRLLQNNLLYLEQKYIC